MKAGESCHVVSMGGLPERAGLRRETGVCYHISSIPSQTAGKALVDQTAQDYTAVAITSWTYLPLSIR